MNRRSFLKLIGGLSASIALPLQAIADVLPKTWVVSAVNWTRDFDLRMNSWIFMGDCWIGKKSGETPTRISIENPVRLGVDIRSATEELDDESKHIALRVLKKAAEREIASLNGI